MHFRMLKASMTVMDESTNIPPTKKGWCKPR